MKIVFFSPFAGVWPTSKNEVELAEGFKREGHQVLFLKCDMDYQNFCISMSSVGLHEDSSKTAKLEVCRRCVSTRKFIDDYFDFPSLNIFDNLTQDDLNSINHEIDKISISDWEEYRYEEFKVGRIAAYEFFLRHKIASLTRPADLWGHFLSQLRNTLLTLFAAKKFFNSFESDSVDFIQRVIVSNSFYSSNRIFCEVAKSFNITTYSISQAGFLFEMSNYLDIQDPFDYIQDAHSENWDVISQIPLLQKEIIKVKKHVEAIIEAKGFWTYSAPLRLSNRKNSIFTLGIPPGTKIVLLAMSSSDEVFAHNMVNDSLSPDRALSNLLFANQFEWLNFVIESFRKTPDSHLIIRPHPREFPNKRERGLSNQAKLIMQFFDEIQLPNNISVNWPDQNISLYRLVPLVDVLLIAWSSVAIEFALFGIPVIAYRNPHLFYPSQLIYIANTSDELVSNLNSALLEGKNEARSILAFRWLSFHHVQSKINVTPAGWGFINPALRIARILYTRSLISVPKFVILKILHFFRYLPMRNSSAIKGIILGEKNGLEFTFHNEQNLKKERSAVAESKYVATVISQLMKKLI